jgi:hypothetical protein
MSTIVLASVPAYSEISSYVFTYVEGPLPTENIFPIIYKQFIGNLIGKNKKELRIYFLGLYHNL